MSNHSHNSIVNIPNTVDCLLINPPDDFSRYPYLGLCLLAAVIRKRGVKVEILDSTALGYTMRDIINHIKTTCPKIIGISTMSMMLQFCYKLIQAVKDSYPEGTVVVGGAHLNADPEIIVPMNVPYGFRGECEFEFADFCEQVISGQTPSPMRGLIINDHGKIYTGEPSFVPNLDSLPMLAYDLLPEEKYFSPSTSLKTMSFISSRGCPYSCVFCSKLEQKPFRYLSTENIINQLENLINGLGFQWIEFVDEIFTLNKQRIIQLCEAVLSRNLKFQWGCGTRADRIDGELVTLMKKAGCRKIGFGIETGVERVRFADGKRITNQQISAAVKICRDHGLLISGSFIFGHPTETEEEMKQTVMFARKLGLNVVYFNKMIPLPDSKLFEVATETGVLEKDIWIDFMLGKRPYPLYTPKGVSPDAVSKIYKKAWFKTYFSPPNIWRNRSLFFNPKQLLRSAKAFAKSCSEKRYDK